MSEGFPVDHTQRSLPADQSSDNTQDNNDLISRIVKLEADMEKEKKSLSRRFGIWAGLVAVSISIFAGGIGIYDRVRSEFEYTERKVQEAQQIARKLSELSMKMAELKATGNHKVVNDFSGIMNIEILNLISNLEALGNDAIRRLQPGDLILFSDYSVSQGKQMLGIELAKLAAEKSITNIMRAESAKQLSRALYADGKYRDLGQARLEVEKAMTFLLASKNVNRFNSAAGVMVSQAIMEAYAGDCEASKSVLKRMRLELLSLPNGALDNYVMQAEGSIAQFSRC